MGSCVLALNRLSVKLALCPLGGLLCRERVEGKAGKLSLMDEGTLKGKPPH